MYESGRTFVPVDVAQLVDADGGRRGFSGPYPILMIEKATSNGHGCADYEQPLREGKIEGRYALEVAARGWKD